MSRITETIMESGDFSISLRADTPTRIKQAVQEWGTVIVTPARVANSSLLSMNQALMQSIYVGTVDSYNGDRDEIRGTSVIALLGAGETGSIIGTKIERTTAVDLNTWLGDLLPANGLSRIAGTGGGTAVGSFQYVSRRSTLEQLSEACGAEWRAYADNSGTLGIQGGDASSLYGLGYTNPKAIAVARGGTRDAGVLGIQARGLSSQRDGAQWVSEVYAIARGDGGAEVGYDSTSSDYYGPDNLPISIGAVVDVPDAQRGTAAAVASSVLDQRSLEIVSVSIDSDGYSISALVRAGECIYVYDLERRLYDPNNGVLYQGRRLPAKKMRVRSIQYSITAKMGVYYFSSRGGNRFVDLSPYVAVDSKPMVRLECSSNLGRPSTGSNYSASPTGDLPKSVSLDQWRDWVVLFTQGGSLSTTRLSGSVTRIGRTVTAEAHGTGGTGGTAGTSIKFTLPIPAPYIVNKPVGWWRWYRSAAGISYGGFVSLSGDGSHAQMNGWTHGPLGNDPNFAPASGDEHYLYLSYEAAGS